MSDIVLEIVWYILYVVGAVLAFIISHIIYECFLDRKEKKIIKEGLGTHISYLQKLKNGDALNSSDRWTWQFAGENILDAISNKRLLRCKEGIREARVIGGMIVGSMRHEDFTASFRSREDESIKRAEEVIKKL